MGSDNGVKKQTWYDRAVVCTEACRGLEDPVAEVRAMVAARESVKRLAAEVRAVREVCVVLKEIIKENRGNLYVGVALACKLERASDKWEECATAVNAASDLMEVPDSDAPPAGVTEGT